MSDARRAWHAVRRVDADRQPRGHHATRHQSAARSVADRRGRYAAHEPAAQPFGHYHPDRQPARAQRARRTLPLVERLPGEASRWRWSRTPARPLVSDPGHMLSARSGGSRHPGRADSRASAVLPALAGRRPAVGQVCILGLYPHQAERAPDVLQGGRRRGLPFVVFEAPHRLGHRSKTPRDPVGAPAGRRPGADEGPRGVRPDHHGGRCADIFRSREVIGEFTLVFGAREGAEQAAGEPLSDETIWASSVASPRKEEVDEKPLPSWRSARADPPRTSTPRPSGQDRRRTLASWSGITPDCYPAGPTCRRRCTS